MTNEARKQYMRDWYLAHKEQQCAKSLAWNRNHKEQVNAAMRATRKKQVDELTTLRIEIAALKARIAELEGNK